MIDTLAQYLMLLYTRRTLRRAWAQCKAGRNVELRSHEVARRYYVHNRGTR